MESNLVVLDKTIPGASRTCAWTADEQVLDLPALAEGDGATAVALPVRTVAVGVIWPIRHVADRVKLLFAGRSPAGPPELQVFDGSRWIKYTDGLTSKANGNALELSFGPIATDMLRVLLMPASGIARMEVQRYLAEATQLVWPQDVATAELTRAFLTRPEEPSFEALRLHGLSNPTWAMTGVKDTGREQAVYWDGQIHCHGRRIGLSLGEDGKPLGFYRDTLRRSLLEGWMPAVIFRGQVEALALTQTSFSIFTDVKGEDHETMFVQIEIANQGKTIFNGPLKVELQDAPKDPFEGTLGVPIFMPAVDRTASTWQLQDGVLTRNGRVFLATAEKCRGGGIPSILVFDLKLPPGKTATVSYVVPSPDWQIDPTEAAALARVPYDQALTLFKAYWERLLAPATKLELPEKRLENMHKNVLAQLFISGYGDTIAYGASPSNYDGAVYGGEIPFAINALAMNSFVGDSQRYMDGCFLRQGEQAMANNPGPQQAITIGLHVTSAVDLFRLTHDRKWIGSPLSLVRQCADWIIARRRDTMKLEDGKRPLHYGLLPPCPSGGDFSRMGYAIFPNFACWRALKDTAWLLDAFGDAKNATRYREEAADYHRTILGVVDRICQRDRKPPFLPLLIDETEPKNADYYQLQTHFIINLWPFDFADPRSKLISDFIEADNRTFCMLPRFRDDGVPGGHRNLGDGGIDGIYALGLLTQCLQQNRIREFLLGFYAFQVFNMEHDCFTSREGNRIVSSDLHLRSSFLLSDWSDPLTCSSAVGLLLLRHLLVTEEVKGAGEYTGNLLVLYGAPRRWYAPGNKIAVEGAATHAGKISFEVRASVDGSRLSAIVTLPEGTKCPAMKIRLRHPGSKPIKSVTIDGQPATSFDPQGELVEVPQPVGKIRIEAAY